MSRTRSPTSDSADRAIANLARQIAYILIMAAPRFDPPPPAVLSGSERFTGLDATVAEFWA